MLKKEEVYVRVSSEKKARKLKEVLDMFNQPQHDSTFQELKSFEAGWLNNPKEIPVLVFEHEEWIGSWLYDNTNKTKVSLKELRNILAREYLKEGDVALFEDKGYKVLGRYKKYSDVFKDFVCDKIEGNSDTTTGFNNFIRYATEEEKQLLKPQESVIEGAISLLRNGLGLDYTSPVIQGLEKLKGK